jgi:hypothetical protein
MRYEDLMREINQTNADYARGQSHDPSGQTQRDAVASREDAIRRYNAANAPAPAPAASPSPTPAIAPKPKPGQTTANVDVVKIADANIVTYDYEQSSIEELEKLYFQNIGGTEILTVARHDNVGGEDVTYALVDNLKELNTEFNPLNILTTESIHKHFNRFAIDMTQRIDSINQAIYVNEEEPMLMVYLYDIKPDEYVQIQVANVANDTDFGDGVVWRNYYGEVK